MIYKWQEISVEFFLESVFTKFWNHEGNTEKKVIEFQYFPGLLNSDHNRRTFLGAGIKLDFPYSERKNSVLNHFMSTKNFEAIKSCEENHALGFVMTGDTIKIDHITLTYNVEASYNLFMKNFGLGYTSGFSPIFLWYNIKKNGNPDFSTVYPKKNRMMRLRFIDLPDFMEIMEYIKEHDYKYPNDFIKDDFKLI